MSMPVVPAWLRRLPLVPTVLVALLVGIMIMLGIWQLQRHRAKTAVIAEISANADKPSVTFPKTGPVDPRIMYRKSGVLCLRVTGWQSAAGCAADGTTGFRYIAQCATGAEGQGALVAVGVAGRPDLKPAWSGGRVTGYLTEEPDRRSLIGKLTQPSLVLRPMLVADAASAGMKTPAPPRPEDIPNNHLGYAVQWFVFAATATIIYLLAARRRMKAS